MAFARDTRQHLIAAVGTIGILVLTCGGMLVGATVWIESSITASNASVTAAINAQADIFAKAQAQMRVEYEHRISALEVQSEEQAHSIDELSAQTEKSHEIDENLTTALQHLTDMMPEKRR